MFCTDKKTPFIYEHENAVLYGISFDEQYQKSHLTKDNLLYNKSIIFKHKITNEYIRQSNLKGAN